LIDYLGDKVNFIVYSRDETKQHEMYTTRRNRNIRYIVGDIRDRDKILHSMVGVDYVFSAAALKHVPTGENFPEEVIQTNILGTKNVIEAAEQCGVKKVIVLSTDKAAYPISAYGASKFMAEKVVAAHRGETDMVCLRYGNVLGSRGSVVPLFLGLIHRGEPLTITNAGMTRFILTLEEAVRLSLKCLYDGNNGDLFVMKPPACTVSDLVTALELHFGRKLPHKIIGIRPGEKMHETLLTGDEVHRSKMEVDGGITYARIPIQRPQDYYFTGEKYAEPDDYTSKNARRFTPEQVLAKLHEAKLL
jgi:UDP-glucose 4-epimerase